jgi:hypothetical protein
MNDPIEYAKRWLDAPEGNDLAGPAQAARRLGPMARKLVDNFKFGHDMQAVTDGLYLVQDVLDRGAVSLLVGPPGTAKTFVGIDICHHIFEGIPWAGQRVEQANCLYIAAEGGLMFADRMVARKARFTVLRHPVVLGGENGWDGPPLAEAVNHLAETQGAAYGLIVIDTLARAMGGADENAGPDMAAFLRAVDGLRDATGAHVMLVHQIGKEQSRGARGHSSLLHSVDTELTVSFDRETNRGLVTVTKQRDGEDGREFGFRLRKVCLGTDQDGDPVFSCVIDHEERTARLTDTERKDCLTRRRARHDRPD